MVCVIKLDINFPGRIAVQEFLVLNSELIDDGKGGYWIGREIPITFVELAMCVFGFPFSA